MTDLATRTRQWLDGTVTPGPDGGWVVDARWTGIKGMVFVLPDQATRAAYLDRAQPLAVRAAGAQSLAQLLSAVGMTLMAAAALLIALGGGGLAGRNNILLILGGSGLMCLGALVNLPTWFQSMRLRTWLRQSGDAYPGRSAPPSLPPLPTRRGRTLAALALVTLSCAVIGCVMLFWTLDWTGWFWTPAGGFDWAWIAALTAVIGLGGAVHWLGEMRRLLRLQRS